ncbi:MAG: DnaB-like helicase C-terminal domain-containing protein [Bacteroidota bacterium]
MITIIDAEKLLVASCLQGRKATLMIADTLQVSEDDSNDRQLRTIFDVCLALSIQRKEVDALAVQSYLRNNVDELYFSGKDKKKELEAVESLCKDVAADYPFLKQIASPYTACQYVKKEAQRRKLMEKIFTLSDKLQSGSDVEAVLNAGISDLLNVSHSMQNLNQKNYVSLSDAIGEAENEIQDELSGKVNWLSTGIPDVDKLIHGLHNECLYIIAAEAKVGKSLLSNQIALHNAVKEIPVGIVSMEMSGREIVKRYAGISHWVSPQNKLQSLEKFKAQAKGKPLYFRQGGTSTKSLFSILQQMVNDRKCKLIILDYLQLIQISEKTRNAVDELNSVLAELKSFAVENQIPIILVSAVLTKQVAGKYLKKPSRADIAWTGEVEPWTMSSSNDYGEV